MAKNVLQELEMDALIRAYANAVQLDDAEETRAIEDFDEAYPALSGLMQVVQFSLHEQGLDQETSEAAAGATTLAFLALTRVLEGKKTTPLS